jgi:hypothetical protein
LRLGHWRLQRDPKWSCGIFELEGITRRDTLRSIDSLLLGYHDAEV